LTWRRGYPSLDILPLGDEILVSSSDRYFVYFGAGCAGRSRQDGHDFESSSRVRKSLRMWLTFFALLADEGPDEE
jgi:hypothetical protein